VCDPAETVTQLEPKAESIHTTKHALYQRKHLRLFVHEHHSGTFTLVPIATNVPSEWHHRQTHACTTVCL